VRYYSIKITNPQTGALIVPPVFKNAGMDASYTSFVKGKTISGAQNIEMDMSVVALGLPEGGTVPYLRVWGVTLYEISQAYQIDGMAIQVFGGMQKGLPLANPDQAGLLFQGYVFQSFGNWIGTDMTLDIQLSAFPSKSTPSAKPIVIPPNLTLSWKKGTKLSDALKQTLTTAYPSFKSPTISISEDVVAPEDITSYSEDVTELAKFVKARSAEIVNKDTYRGVDIAVKQGAFNVYDGSTQSDPKQIAYQDMIGQPTWVQPATIQAKFVMRSDIAVGDFIKFPKSPVVSSAQSVSPFVNEKLTFQGSFFVQRVRHVGNFRQADAASWVTVVDAVTQPVADTATVPAKAAA
jgi:hypothetical protein